MALQTTGSAGLSDEMKTYYDRRLLEYTRPELVHAKFGQVRSIPRRGGKTVEFRRFSTLDTATTALTEGTLFTNLKPLEVTAIEATIAQYGDAVGFSDLVSTTTIDNVLEETVDLLALQAGESLDEIYRTVLNAGTNVLYVGARTGRTDIEATDYLTAADVARIALTLKMGRAKKIDGAFHAVIHPRVAHDLQQTTEWETANNEHRTGRIFDGSLGMLYGIKFWETDKAYVWENASNGAGAAGTIDVYSTLVFGANAYGVVGLEGHNLRSIFKPLGSAGTADALDQQQTMGWKVATVAKILNDSFMVRYESTASTATNS